ncbi:pyridoxal-phosphate dependent enzyme [Levilinea saccharolytica]|uniref:Tryptophan synthase beta chain-like PALP domain-containing protein n=3 Tax=Levilinea saccharolytica TaxID=229921 RepID=A0A0P6YDK1_9CHLR|nr:pyridoxal-phosphate dependent enzyme [Levilinea saccharolytica]KPL80085.1 hypothetical protein ADN01_12515 [Levilinea saccharolytica]
MPTIRCVSCRQAYPAQGLPHVCPTCGGVFDFDGPPLFDPAQVDPRQPGMWRYRAAFDLFSGAPVVTLGEGQTPLVWVQRDGRSIGLKLESLNPTGSYKDRGTAVLISQLRARGAESAVEDSSGNAGASFAAYAARAGMRGRVFVPASASGPKRIQIEAYGAELAAVAGPRSAAAAAVMEEVLAGAVYASHAYLPFGLSGIATIAYELWETLGGAPGTVVAPAGHGGLLLGLVRGFAALEQAGLIARAPFYVGVQAAACAPMAEAFSQGLRQPAAAAENTTLAEGVRVTQPVRGAALLHEIPPGKGLFTAVPEAEILPAAQALNRQGIYVEPTSALVWAALSQVRVNLPEPVILILTGNGLKYIPTAK